MVGDLVQHPLSREICDFTGFGDSFLRLSSSYKSAECRLPFLRLDFLERYLHKRIVGNFSEWKVNTATHCDAELTKQY
jgi:hypothetical protein